MKVLIVEDDRDTAEMVKQQLQSDSHLVEVANDGADGSFLGRSYEYDAIVLDNSLPKKNGITVCKEIRASGRSTPIVFVSVDDDNETKISAFKEGADDYVTKPFSLTELRARLKAVTRRSTQIRPQVYEIGDLKVDTESQSVTRAGKSIHLTKKEYALLEYFMRHKGIILPRILLIEHVWSSDSDPLSNTVESHIRNLRKKLAVGGRPSLIKNLPGRGYVMDTLQNLSRF